MAGRGTDILLGGNPEFMAKDACLKEKVAEQLPKGQEVFIADQQFFYFYHLGAFYRVPRAKWDETFWHYKAQTDREHDEVVAMGGLHITATERHESRRIDNQLRGRAGRQGDPGSSRFFLSLQDDLLRIFGGDRIQNLMLRLGMEEDVPIESKLITRRIAKAQEAVEAQNFAARKHLLEYDDVMNKQRQAVYGMRRDLLEGKEQIGRIQDMVRGLVRTYVELRCGERTHPTEWDLAGLRNDLLSQFGVKLDTAELGGERPAAIEDIVHEQLLKRYAEKEVLVGAAVMRETERMIMLHVIDDQWKDHLLSMDHLKEGIGLRGYGQKDPLVEYKKESYVIFEEMMDRVEDETLRYLFFLQPASVESMPMPFEPVEEPEEEESEEEAATDGVQRAAAQGSMLDFTKNILRKKDREMAELQFAGGGTATAQQPVIKGQKVGRNDPCPCGSGKKYKKCCGA
jgi:preprotein translocase subunit SecA